VRDPLLRSPCPKGTKPWRIAPSRIGHHFRRGRALVMRRGQIYSGAMTDDAENLRATLAELHRQLETAQRLDPDSRATVRQAMADIEEVLTRIERTAARAAAGGHVPDSPSREHASIVGRLAAAARGFESTHPTLSGAIGSVCDALAQIGI
jgi:hypothetical protein